MWLRSHPYKGVDDGVVPHTAQTRKEAGTGEGWEGMGLAGIGDKLISLTGDSGSYSFSANSGLDLEILGGTGGWAVAVMDLSSCVSRVLRLLELRLHLGSRDILTVVTFQIHLFPRL